ncbi:Zinc knuckle family protein [Panicum miliaceum]|uniref:Zinc knuckle family protein n=1 Tax=Panicum miliaceum TaxID=4540 RepID=A0A3L6RJA2_PANMI|nr:Zinc knuckle family protein [Panicum miliaceum]
MARGTKVQETLIPCFQPTSTFDNAQNDLEDEEEQHRAFMIKEFGKKGFKEIKKLMEKLEKKKETLKRQEDLLILEKEKNLALEKSLSEEKVKVDKLAIDLSLTNHSSKRISKEKSLVDESLGSLKNTHSELQDSFSCLTVKYKDLEINYSAIWKSTKADSKATFDSNVSTSEGCSKCYKIDVQACVTNLAKLEKLIKAKDAQLERLNKLVRNGYDGDFKPESKVVYKKGRRPHKMDGLGHYHGVKANDRGMVKGKECDMFTKGAKLKDLMNIALGVTTTTPPQAKKKVEAPINIKVVKHEPSPSYTTDYMVTMDNKGKIVVKYVGAYTKKAILRNVWVPKVYPSNPQGPKSF